MFGKKKKQNKKDNMMKFQLCPNCKTGKRDYELNPHSPVCTHIGYYNQKKGLCTDYKPMKK